MASTDVKSDVFYDLVSIQYHALQATNSYQEYLNDARSAENPEITEFIEQCKQQDMERAQRCHKLLADLS
jgi:hypothetical protein